MSALCTDRNRTFGLLGIVDSPPSDTMVRAFQRLLPAIRGRLRLEAAFRRADRLDATARSLLDLVPREVFLCDGDGRIHDANAAGFSRLAGEPQLRETIATCVRLERNTADWELRLRRGNSRAFTVVSARGSTAGRRETLAAFTELWDLSERQRDVLALALDGCTNRVIASSLGISDRTVEVHLSSIYERTGVKNRAELVALVFR